MKKVVAFLQNPWFKPDTPNHVIRLYREDADYRRRVLALSMSGRRLESAFGPFFSDIHWDNANPLHGNTPGHVSPPDLLHIERVLRELQPGAVLLFGGNASRGYEFVLAKCQDLYDLKTPYHCFPHPNARGLTQFQINEFAEQIINRYLK